MQTNAKAAQPCFKASKGPHPPLKTPVQKDTPREPKKNIQLHYDQRKTIQEKQGQQKGAAVHRRRRLQYDLHKLRRTHRRAVVAVAVAVAAVVVAVVAAVAAV